jgi:ribonucleotide monophosphatase NagD (HAD superfamily)
VILSDIWGVVHKGSRRFPKACERAAHFPPAGGTVILITNAPRPADSVQRQLRKLGVADDTYDAIVSSGDLTRISSPASGKRMYWLGPERPTVRSSRLDPVSAPLEQADYIVCTGRSTTKSKHRKIIATMMLQARRASCRDLRQPRHRRRARRPADLLRRRDRLSSIVNSAAR